MTVSQSRADCLVVLEVHFVVARTGLAPRILKASRVALIGLVVIGGRGRSAELNRVVHGGYVLSCSVLVEYHIEQVCLRNCFILFVVVYAIGKVNNLVSVVEYGISILTQRLEPSRLILVGIHQIGNLAGSELIE